MQTSNPIPVRISIVDSHPQNPRPEITPESVQDLVDVMTGEHYSEFHPITVREIKGDRFQVVSGHRRLAAAKLKGYTEIFVVVREMSDQEAFLELVRANAQSELDPLHIGIHAYYACNLAAGGKGIKGGVSEYARQIGRDRGDVSRLRAAGEVAAKVCHVTQVTPGMARQLYEISRLPEPLWQQACDWMFGLTAEQKQDRMGTVKDVNARVSAAMSLELPEEIKGTGKELTARMDVFHGRESKFAPPKTTEPPAEIEKTQVETEPTIDIESEPANAVVTSREPTTIEKAPRTSSNALSEKPESVDVFDPKASVAVSRGLQRGVEPTAMLSTDDEPTCYCDEDHAITRSQVYEYLSRADIHEVSDVIAQAYADRDTYLRHNILLSVSYEMSDQDCDDMDRFLSIRRGHLGGVVSQVD